MSPFCDASGRTECDIWAFSHILVLVSFFDREAPFSLSPSTQLGADDRIDEETKAPLIESRLD